MAHINLLPVEILQYIFTLGSLGPLSLGHLRSLYRVGPRQHLILPLAISSVCGYWRAIALSTGLLWSTVVLYLPGSDMQPFQQNTAVIALQLQRVGNCPIDMVVESNSPSPATSSLEYLLPLFPRCRSLVLTLYRAQYSEIFPLSNLMPHLKLVSIYLIGSSLYPDLPILCDPSVAPSLEEVKLDALSSPMLPTLSSSKLKHIQVGSVRPQDFPTLYEFIRKIDDSDVPLIRHLTLPHPIMKMNRDEAWIPPMWTREVETLSVSHLSGHSISSLRATLCALKPRQGEVEADANQEFMHFPSLKELELSMMAAWAFQPTDAKSVLKDLITIVEHRADLQLRVQEQLVSKAGEGGVDVFVPYGDRVSIFSVGD
ncbi:hypothetical protein DL93DRAFT_2102126 [Clavulina sp. PMI_390]|nr:hypothetical protein DL93DRAFT_2102126 [Clavulina sp. PMI_390]